MTANVKKYLQLSEKLDIIKRNGLEDCEDYDKALTEFTKLGNQLTTKEKFDLVERGKKSDQG